MEIPEQNALESFLLVSGESKFDSKGEVEFLDGGIVVERQENGDTKRICGHLTVNGDYCRRQAGLETIHPGVGHCKIHSTQRGDISILQTLGEISESTGNLTLREYIELADNINDVELKKVENETKLLYVLVSQLFKNMGPLGMTVAEETRLKSLIRELRETKLVRGKLETLTKVDAAYITWIIDKVAEIVQRFAPQQSGLIINKILDTVRDPYNSAVQSGVSVSLTEKGIELKEIDG